MAAHGPLKPLVQVQVLAPQFQYVRTGCEHVFVPRYSEQEAREAVASSWSYAQALRKLGLRPVGGNHQLFRKYVDEVWHIPTDHFDADRARSAKLKRNPLTPLEEVLVENSTYSRSTLKQRLYATGLKSRVCELCGQDEHWNGALMSLILDHINGVYNDNRIENLRIICPNCAATLITHCGRKNRIAERGCARCGTIFRPSGRKQRYCSRYCGMRHDRRNRGPQPETRKVPRPSYAQLLSDLDSMSYCAVGRKYGVSDNAVRKWLRWYRREQEREDGGDGLSLAA
jgi:hypothetical protein